MGLIIEPFTFIDVTVGMDQSTTPIGHVILPVAFVLGAVWPDL
jgi:hypothetical protein